MTLRETAQRWLDNYKAQKADCLFAEEMAAIVAEYLHETPNGAEGEATSERTKAL